MNPEMGQERMETAFGLENSRSRPIPGMSASLWKSARHASRKRSATSILLSARNAEMSSRSLTTGGRMTRRPVTPDRRSREVAEGVPLVHPRRRDQFQWLPGHQYGG